MWDRYHEPLSLKSMAESAYLSRFYFSRLFRATTGVSPGRFLAAIRLFKAKNLLRQTSLSVTDIAYQVGYNSLGTFTSRFTRSVGIPPARYRSQAGVGIPAPPLSPRLAGQGRGRIAGRVTVPYPPATPARARVGAFESPIVHGLPGAWDLLDGDEHFELRDLPDRAWYVWAAVVTVDDKAEPQPSIRRPLFVGVSGPVEVRRGGHAVVD